MRKTKIICTLGPATDSEETLRQMIEAGMNVARFNFSHGSYDEHLRRLNMLRKVREEMNQPIAALLDTKGPEIRLRDFAEGKVFLKKGSRFTLTTRAVEGTEEICSISYRDLPQDVSVGTRLLLDDGLIELTVDSIEGTDIHCIVRNSGYVSNRKSVNVPDVRLSMPYLSKQDEKDIVFGIENGFDFIAASFTRCARDVLDIREVLDRHKCDHIRIIAKIENREGVQNIEEILAVSDGIMVARGDMGVEIDFTEIPIIQKNIIWHCYNSGKPVITATQMLESMINNPPPHPRGDNRRRQCNLRRHLGHHALGRDRRRPLPRRGRQDDVCDCRAHRERHQLRQTAAQPWSGRSHGDHRCDCPRRMHHRDGHQGESDRHRLKERRHRPSALQIPAHHPDHRLRHK